METLVANITGKTRKETLNGKEYIVAPMSLISPGVLNGSKGPLYYPKEELAKNPEDWNHIPITVYHPLINGMPTSARDPDILSTQGIGYVFNAKVNGKLTAEGWFDIEATERVDNRILEALEEGKEIELSTGLYPQKFDPAKEGATHNGKSYSFIARDYRPDHLAILPDQVGACSIQDGCGVLVNQKTRQATVHPCCDGWITTNDISHSELHELLSKQLRAKFTQDEPNVWISDVFDTYIVYWQGDDLYKLSYTKTGSDVNLSSETPQKVVRETTFVTVTNLADEEISMAKKELVDELVANCSCWTDEDKEVLNKMDDKKVQAFIDGAKAAKQQELIANSFKDKKFTVEEGSKTLTLNFNEKTGQLEPDWVKEESKKEEPVANKEGSKEKKPQTEAEWLASAPAGIQSAVQNAMRIETRERTNLIEKITANVEDEDAKKRLSERLNAKPLDELEDLALLAVNKKQDQTNNSGSLASFFGNAGGSPSSTKEIKPLGLPTINWAEEKKAATAS